MKSKKPVVNISVKKIVIMLAIVLVGATLITYLILGGAKKSQEVAAFKNLGQDMKNLLVEFNKINSGWKYNESCRGRGGDFDKNIPSSCTVSLTNDSHDFSDKQVQSIETYLSIIANNNNFEVNNVIDPVTEGGYFSSVRYKPLSGSICTIETYKSISDEDSQTNATFGCIDQASKFHFPRNDI